MCSIEEGESVLTPKKESGHANNGGVKLCFKCKQKKAVLITRVCDALCKECFQVYTTHKFRAAIGKSKLIRDGERVLVAFSGGRSSNTLLCLIQEGLSERAHKKLRFRPALLYVDEGAITDMDLQDRSELTQYVANISKESGFPLYMICIEEAIQNDFEFHVNSGLYRYADTSHFESRLKIYPVDPVTTGKTGTIQDASEFSSFDNGQKLNRNEKAKNNLNTLLSSFKSLSSKEEFLRLFKQRIFLCVAKKYGYSQIMTGDCSTQLSIRMLTDIAQGKGAHAALDTCFADKRDPDVTILRPLRDFSVKDIAMFNVLFGVESRFTPSLATKAVATASIGHLTEAFLTGLQTDYPSTMSTIMKTAEKLDTSVESKEHCSLCRAPLDTASALNSVEFSRNVSKKSDLCKTEVACCGEGDGSCQTNVVSLLKTEKLCYSCRITVYEMKDKTKLPVWLTDGTTYNERRSRMKVEIQQYLLDN